MLSSGVVTLKVRGVFVTFVGVYFRVRDVELVRLKDDAELALVFMSFRAFTAGLIVLLFLTSDREVEFLFVVMFC